MRGMLIRRKKRQNERGGGVFRAHCGTEVPSILNFEVSFLRVSNGSSPSLKCCRRTSRVAPSVFIPLPDGFLILPANRFQRDAARPWGLKKNKQNKKNATDVVMFAIPLAAVSSSWVKQSPPFPLIRCWETKPAWSGLLLRRSGGDSLGVMRICGIASAY